MNRTTHQIEPEEVMAYLDGELAPDAAAALSSHLESCAECAAVAADLRVMSSRMLAWQVEPAPETFSDARLAAPVNSSNQTRQNRALSFEALAHTKRRWLWPVVGAAATVTIMLAALAPNFEVVQELPPHPVVAPSPIGAPPSDAKSTASSDAIRPQTRSLRTNQPWDPAAAERQVQGGHFANSPRRTVAETVERASNSRVNPSLGPMVIRTASIKLETKQFDATRAAIERIVRGHGGHLGQLQTAAPTNQARSLTATLRIPAARLDSALAEVKKLGRVTHESQGSDEVTDHYTDLVARLSNARHTEQRLVEILRTRTGKVADVLEVEREIAEVREQIERMDGQRNTLENQVALSTVSLELREEFEKKMEVAPPTTGTLLWNALVDGYNAAVNTIVGLALFLLRAAPSLLLWAVLLFFPARSMYRRLRTHVAAQ